MTEIFRLYRRKPKDAIEADYQNELLARLYDDDEEELGWELMDSVQESADGCSVEPDGTCPHGYVSPSVLLGII